MTVPSIARRARREAAERELRRVGNVAFGAFAIGLAVSAILRVTLGSGYELFLGVVFAAIALGLAFFSRRGLGSRDSIEGAGHGLLAIAMLVLADYSFFAVWSIPALLAAFQYLVGEAPQRDGRYRLR
ncbi:MAG: hypothetical protein ACYTHK_00190 [Planctomycetota bacterium]|jgi:hypothetical protein